MIDGLSLLYSCFNQYVFQEAKNNIRDLEYWFSTNPSTCGNILVANLIDAIKKYDLESIGQPLFQSILVRSGKNEQESNPNGLARREHRNCIHDCALCTVS